MPPASNRKARILVYALILAITGAVTATAIATAIPASTSHPPRKAQPAIAGHQHRLRSTLHSRRTGGTGSRVLLIATGLQLPAPAQDLSDASQAEPPGLQPQPPRHGQGRRFQGLQPGTHKGKQ
jgi:hypothetical protein